VPTFGQWRYTVDVATTTAAYAHAPYGDAQRCGCSTCRNFVAVRDVVLPEDFQDFLVSLGVDPAKEGEVYHLGQSAPGSHVYGGWYHFVGSLEAVGDFAPVQFGDDFNCYMCRRSAPCLPALDGQPLVQVEFHAENVPWIIEDEEPA
jgi:hypothetical protein